MRLAILVLVCCLCFAEGDEDSVAPSPIDKRRDRTSGDVTDSAGLGKACRSIAWGQEVVLMGEFNPEKAAHQSISALFRLGIKHVLLLVSGAAK